MSKISSTSDFQSMYSAQGDDEFVAPTRVSSSRSLQPSSGVLRDLSPRRSNVSSASSSYASATSSFGSEQGSDAASEYARSRASSAHSSDSVFSIYPKTHSEASSARSSDSGWIIYPSPHSEVGSVAGEPANNVVETLSEASARYSIASSGSGQSGSFHLSDRASVVAALGTGRMGYSSDSSRRLTSYEGSTEASSEASSVPSSVRSSSSYRASLTPSSEFAVRAALVRGRLNGPGFQPDRRSSASASSVSSLHLSEANDVLTPLRPSRFRAEYDAVSNPPSEIHSALSSSRLSTALSSSRRLGATGVAPRVTRGDVESLSNASVLEGHLRPAGRRNPQISPDEFWAFLNNN